MIAQLTATAVADENAHLLLPAKLAAALGHHPAPRIAAPADIIEVLADPMLSRWHGWARDRALDAIGVAVQVEAAGMRERRQTRL